MTRSILICSAILIGVTNAQVAADANRVDVIVRFKPSPDGIGAKRFAAHGAVHKRSLAIVGAEVFTVDSKDLALLAADPEVDYLGLDHPVHSTTTLPSTPDYGWMTVLGVSSSTAILPYDGTGIGVAVIDSGIAGSPSDLQSASGKNRVVYQQSLIPQDNDNNDHYGHGTMVAGLVAGNGKDSTGPNNFYTVRGIAPNANIISLRVLDNNGAAVDSTVIAGIETAIQLKNQYNIRVINLSLGRPVYESCSVDPLCQAVQQAWRAGIVVVVAAGNDGRNNTYGNEGYGTINAPGNSPYAITVGAMNTMGTLPFSDDKMTSYSSKGPTLLDHVVKPDIVAPGNRVVSIQGSGSYLVATYPNNKVAQDLYTAGNNSGPSSQYFELSGTSLAAPMVSGAAALLIQQNPSLTPDQVKARLMLTATKLPHVTTYATDPVTGITYTSQNDIFTVGAGYLNVPAALASTALASGSAASPVASWNSTTGAVSLVTGNSAVWGSSAVWGNSVVWGMGTVSGNSVVWGNSAVWGNSVAWGSSAVWGASAVWGNSVVWGNASLVESDALTIAINGEN